jgi:DNA-binding beta-propeller fold protein YncE
MRRLLTAIVAAAVLALGGSLVAQTSVQELAFDTNADFIRTPPDVYVGEVGGVAANSKGQLYVYTRTGHPYATLGDNRTFYRGGSRLFQFDPSGKFIRELGQDVYGFNAAIGLRVDPQDNVWTIDAGANQVVKFNTEGHVALVLGRKPETMPVRPPPQGAGGGPGGGGPGGGGGGGGGGQGGAAANRRPGEGIPGSSFNRPTDVAWDSAGNIYVADGIGTNNRIAKFDKDGRFIRHWGATGSQPGEFRGVKALAIDARGNVYAADYGNRRIQIFDADGKFLNQWKHVGSPWGLYITDDQSIFMCDGYNNRILKLSPDGSIVGSVAEPGRLPGQLDFAHHLTVGRSGSIYVAEIKNWRAQKFSPR